MSGGERNRVALARMLVEPANTLLLDEPTNHLDPASVDVLTDALIDFQGTIVFISHDPVFLSRVATRVVEIEDGRVKDYLADYEYYLWKRSQELEALKAQEETQALAAPKKQKARQPSPATTASLPTKKPNRRDMTKTINRLEKQVARSEEEITALEDRIKARAEELATPKLYRDFPRWNELHQEHERWKEELDVLTNQWSALSTELADLKDQLAKVG